MAFTFDSDVEDEKKAEVGLDDEFGYFNEEEFLAMGIIPADPTDARPGSEEKVMMLAARYAAGLPLWHDEDRYDHAPGMIDLSQLGGA
ncbi:MAG: hypothetical protein AAF532_16650 [Planctomycetota bacterium]